MLPVTGMVPWLPYLWLQWGSNSQIKRTLEPSSALTNFDKHRWTSCIIMLVCYCSPSPKFVFCQHVLQSLEMSWKCLETLFDSVSSFVSRWVRSCTSASAERPVGSCGGRATGSRCPWVKRNVPGVVALPQLQHISIHFHSPVPYSTILPSNSRLHLFTLSVLSCSIFFQNFPTFGLELQHCTEQQKHPQLQRLVSSPHKVKNISREQIEEWINDSMIVNDYDYEIYANAWLMEKHKIWREWTS